MRPVGVHMFYLLGIELGKYILIVARQLPHGSSRSSGKVMNSESFGHRTEAWVSYGSSAIFLIQY